LPAPLVRVLYTLRGGPPSRYGKYMKLELLKLNRQSSVVCYLTSVFCILSSVLTNKPNSPNVQMNLTYLSAMNYTFFISLTKVKNKPNSNPIKANFKQDLQIESKWTMQASLTEKSLDICLLNLFGSDNVTDAGVAKLNVLKFFRNLKIFIKFPFDKVARI
jgi:hypothetical protein